MADVAGSSETSANSDQTTRHHVPKFLLTIYMYCHKLIKNAFLKVKHCNTVIQNMRRFARQVYVCSSTTIARMNIFFLFSQGAFRGEVGRLQHWMSFLKHTCLVTMQPVYCRLITTLTWHDACVDGFTRFILTAVTNCFLHSWTAHRSTLPPPPIIPLWKPQLRIWLDAEKHRNLLSLWTTTNLISIDSFESFLSLVISPSTSLEPKICTGFSTFFVTPFLSRVPPDKEAPYHQLCPMFPR